MKTNRALPALLCALLVAAGSVADLSAQKKKKKGQKEEPATIEQLRKESRNVEKQLKVTDRKLNDNAAATRRNLNRLDKLRSDMQANRATVAATRSLADTLEQRIGRLNDTIAALEVRRKEMQDAYARSLRSLQLQSAGDVTTSSLAYIFSSESVAQAWRRIRYLKQFSKWRQRKAAEVGRVADELSLRRDRLAAEQQRKADALQRLDLAQRQLASQQQETEKLVASLKKEAGSLQAELQRQQKQQRDLDSRIDRLIAEEAERRRKLAEEAERKRRIAEEKQREAEEIAARNAAQADGNAETPAKPKTKPKIEAKPAPSKPKPQAVASDEDIALTGTFASNKGRLLFPVSGRYSIARPFGLQQHPELRHVTTDNSGIDIEAPQGATARAVFKGKVSAIFQQEGYGSIVMVRHGDYLTIYAGLSSLNVRNGQSLKAGDTIGRIFTDPDNDSRTILHFELRHERTKLNPSDWLRR